MIELQGYGILTIGGNKIAQLFQIGCDWLSYKQ